MNTKSILGQAEANIMFANIQGKGPSITVRATGPRRETATRTYRVYDSNVRDTKQETAKPYIERALEVIGYKVSNQGRTPAWDELKADYPNDLRYMVRVVNI